METSPKQKGYSKSKINFISRKNSIFRAEISLSMITSTLDQLHWYRIISPNFEKAIQYVLNTDFGRLETGKYPVDGENVFAIVNEYTTKPLIECDPESHRDYADIQIVITGAEKFGYTPLVGQPASIPYDPEKDVAFYSWRKKTSTT